MAKKAKSSGLSVPQSPDSRVANQQAAYESNAAAAHSVDKGAPLSSPGGLVASGSYTKRKK